MKLLLRVAGSCLAISLIIVLSTLTVTFIRKVWFGGDSRRDHVAVMEIKGMLTDATAFVRNLEDHLENPSVRALIVRINTPGGLVGPSQELYHAIKKADEKVPVVIAMGSVAASGGYYAAIGGRQIFAEPGALTASIGVIMEMMNSEKLLQWARVDMFTLKAGKLKDAGSPFRAMKPEEREYFLALLAEVHQQFRADVQARRKLTAEELDAAADGRVMSGSQALKAKLVDKLGGLQDAIAEAKKLAKLPDTAPVEYPDVRQGLLRKVLIGDEEDESSLKHFSALLGAHLPNAAAVLSGASPAWRILLLAPVR